MPGQPSNTVLRDLVPEMFKGAEPPFIATDPGRATRWRVNGTTQDLASDNGSGIANASNTVLFTDVSPISGVITIGWSKAPGTGDAPANAVRIIENAGPSVSITGPLQPGEVISGSYSDFTSAPTALTLTDSNGNSISSASEITDLVIDDVNKTFLEAMKAEGLPWYYRWPIYIAVTLFGWPMYRSK